MSWNGSVETAKTEKGGGVRHRVKRPLFWWLLSVFFVALVVVIWLFIPSQDAKPKEVVEFTYTSQIKTVKPAVPTNVEVIAERKKYWEVPASQTNGFTAVQQRRWIYENRQKPGYTNTTALTEAPPEYAIFSHHSENIIASYLTMEPGETLVGTPRYGKAFTKDFLESLKEPIIVKQDDSEYVKSLKRQMNETKIELKARYDAGENIGKILEETHEQYQELASYKDNIKQALYDFKNSDDATRDDVEDFITAANLMLEKKGIAPLKLSPIAKRMLMLRKDHKSK